MGASNYLLQRSQEEKKEMIKHWLPINLMPSNSPQLSSLFSLVTATHLCVASCGSWSLPSKRDILNLRTVSGFFPMNNCQKKKRKKREKYKKIYNFLKSLHNLTLWLILVPAPNILHVRIKYGIGNIFIFIQCVFLVLFQHVFVVILVEIKNAAVRRT